jgi:hypothetical protein
VYSIWHCQFCVFDPGAGGDGVRFGRHFEGGGLCGGAHRPEAHQAVHRGRRGRGDALCAASPQGLLLRLSLSLSPRAAYRTPVCCGHMVCCRPSKVPVRPLCCCDMAGGPGQVAPRVSSGYAGDDGSAGDIVGANCLQEISALAWHAVAHLPASRDQDSQVHVPARSPYASGNGSLCASCAPCRSSCH